MELGRACYIHHIWGSASALIHKGTRCEWDPEGGIIIGWDWEKGEFHHTDIETVTEELGVSEAVLTDLVLISGYSILPTMPELDMELGAHKVVAAKALLNRAGDDGYTACYRSSDETYPMLFHYARYAVDNPVVFRTDTLEVNMLRPKDMPPDAHEYCGGHLPNEAYWYMIRGLVNPRVLAWRSRGEILETPPLDGGLSQTYRDLVSKKLVPLRAQALIISTYRLHNYYRAKDLEQMCWFNPDAKTALQIPDNLSLAEPADYWNVTLDKMPGSPEGRQALRFAIGSLTNAEDAKKTITHHKPNTPHVLTKLTEVRPNVVWRFLEQREYLTKEHTLAPWGKALQAALDNAANSGAFVNADISREVEEAIFVGLELVRMGLLNTSNMFQVPPYSGPPMRGSDTDRQHVLLISRVACLATITHKPIGYTGPLSRHLLAYHQVAAAVRNALRDLVEMHACNLLWCNCLARDVLKGHKDRISTLSFSLPFLNEPDAGLGLLVKTFLDECSNESPRQRPRDSVAEWFVHALDIDRDLAKAWKLFAAVS